MPAAAAPPIVPRAAVTLAADAALPTDPALADIPFSVRLSVDFASDASIAQADARAVELERSRARIWIVAPTPAAADAVDPWRDALRRWLRRHRNRVAILELELGHQPVAVTALAVSAAASELRAADADAQLAVAAPADARDVLVSVLTRGLAPYVDLVAAASVDDAEKDLSAVEGADPGIHAVVTGLALPADAGIAAAVFARAVVASFGSRIVSIAASGDHAAEPFAAALRWMKPLLAGDLQVLDAHAASLTVRAQDGADPAFVSPPRLLFDNASALDFPGLRRAGGGRAARDSGDGSGRGHGAPGRARRSGLARRQ